MAKETAHDFAKAKQVAVALDAQNVGLLRSEELRRAMEDAMLGRPKRFEDLLAFHSGLPGPRPAHALASAVGDALATDPRSVKLVAKFADSDAKADTAAVFLPIVAAYTYASRVRTGKAEECWTLLWQLAADGREPVRRGATSAIALACKTEGGVNQVVRAAQAFLSEEDRDFRWGAIATALDGIGAAQAEQFVTARAEFLDMLSALAFDVADAPRATERLDGRRRVLLALGDQAARVANAFRGEPDGTVWLEGELAKARHPDLRKAFERTLEKLRARGNAQKSETLASLNAALLSSKKPPRDPAKIRADLRGRGKKHRVKGHH